MCRVMMMTGVKNGLNAVVFMQAALTHMAKGNRDGVGYAAIDGDGKMFAERWLDPDVAFIESMPKNKRILDKLRKGLVFEVPKNEYAKHGELNFEGIKSLIYHTRFATCAKTFSNVHPFINGDTALIHNGVIRNDNEKPLRKEISTCDSEVILNSYLDNSVNTNPHDIQFTTDELAGYWACGVLSKTDQGLPILDIFRNDAGAKLYSCYVEEIGGEVFCTDSDIIYKTLQDLDWKTDMHSFLVKPHTLQRFNALTGDLLETIEIEPHNNFGYWNETKTYSKKSFNKNGKKVQLLTETTTPLNDDTPTDSKYFDKYLADREEMEKYYRTSLHEQEKLWVDGMLKHERDDYLYECIQ